MTPHLQAQRIQASFPRRHVAGWVPACDASCQSKRLCVRADHVSDVYAEMRRDEAAAQMPHSYTTARTLMSILRLSQGLARLRFADSVAQVR